AAEVEQCVAQRAVGGSVIGSEPDGLPGEAKALPELVTRVGERGLALRDQSDRAVGQVGAVQRGAREAVEGRIAGLACALLVGEPKNGEAAGVGRAASHMPLEFPDVA